jgi:hypothetical protein
MFEVREALALNNYYGKMPTINIPWGPSETLALSLSTFGSLAEANIDIVEPNLQAPIVHYALALRHALDHPVKAPRLEEQVGPGSTVAIVVDDPSRWTPVREALPIVLERLHRIGIRYDDITISIGVGRHLSVDTDAMRQRVGQEITSRYRCYSPPVDNLSAYDDLGQTPNGAHVWIFQPVARASLRILIGSVLPHLQAGFGGGYKLIFPGTSHRTTLAWLHEKGLNGHSDPKSFLGERAAHNAMRQTIHAAAALLGPCWSVSHLTGGRGQIFRIAAGCPRHVQNILAEEAAQRLEAPGAPAVDLVIAGNDPWPGDPMQSFKVLLHHRAACLSGGVLAGLFWTDPDEIDRSFPISALKCIAATGRLGGWHIQRLLPLVNRVARRVGSSRAFMMHWACELVVHRTVLVYSPALYARIGRWLGPVQIFDKQRDMWQTAITALARRHVTKSNGNLNVRVFPRGGLTYVAESSVLV